VQRVTLHTDRRAYFLEGVHCVLYVDGIACASGERASMIALLDDIDLTYSPPVENVTRAPCFIERRRAS
jgi:hypothetical protein